MPQTEVITSQQSIPAAHRQTLPPKPPRVKAGAQRPPDPPKTPRVRLKVGGRVDMKH